jgi:uncharacterized protein (DUF488 family)
VSILAGFDVRALADIRRFPGSRRNPQFSMEPLRASLAAAGIDYQHFVDLGGRRSALPDSANTALTSMAFRGYADHMASPEFQTALERLLVAAEARTTAVMCAEAVPWQCHRHLLADAVAARGWTVGHITGPGRLLPHELSSLARVAPGGAVTYPGLW